MNRIYNPADVPPPVGNYSHAIEVASGARTLFISGQVGVLADGKPAAGIEAQAEAVWQNIFGILRAAEMQVTDLVKVNIYLVDRSHIPASRVVRDRHLGGHKPASTLAVIAALASPDSLIEIEAVAAKT